MYLNEKEDINKLKNEIKKKDNIIKKMKEELLVLSKPKVEEQKAISVNEELNELVDENEELKKINKELIEKLNEYNTYSTTRTKTDINKEDNLNESTINYDDNEKQNQIIMEQKEELELLRSRFEQLYKELNQYRQKNYDLNMEIKKLKGQSLNESKNIFSINDECTISKIRKSYNNEIEKLTDKLNDIEVENKQNGEE